MKVEYNLITSNFKNKSFYCYIISATNSNPNL